MINLLPLLSNLATWKAVILVAVFLSGWHIKGWQVASQDLKQVKTNIKDANKQASKDEKILDNAAKIVTKIEIVYRDKIVEKTKYVKTTNCPKHDPEYVSLYNEAIKEFNASLTNKTN